ncbi:hypothetical protein CAL7716_080900 [Calothrix sp. PCC 7716]|nr:hypothetical protein CAL7716_080900 [Calothrix sp. PCC 7716]
MRSLKLSFVVLASAGLLLLGACSNQASEPSSSNTNGGTTETAGKTETASKTETAANSDGHTDHSHSGKGGQVVESGKYHLEMVPEKEGNATHLDFYLQTGDKHEAVPNAKVTADIQSPDGKQKTVPLTYDASGKHYTTKLDAGAAGQYQVKITAAVGSETVNGRFNFNQ